jgi:hypothetical protein
MTDLAKVCESAPIDYESLIMVPVLIPSTCIYKSLAKLTGRYWNLIKTNINDIICFYCSDKAEHLHEEWILSNDSPTRTLNRLTRVCIKCHNAIHLGSIRYLGSKSDAIERFKAINKLSDIEFDRIADKLVEECEIFGLMYNPIHDLTILNKILGSNTTKYLEEILNK